jgi:hypothetical protein
MDIVDRLRTIMDPPNYETSLAFEAADEIEQLREALRDVLSVQPIKGDEGSTDIIALAKALLEIDSIARAALKEKE